MKLQAFIDILTTIEQRHQGREIEVEVRDEAGYPLADFNISTEYFFPHKRITVRFTPPQPGAADDNSQPG